MIVQYLVTIECDTVEQAETVITERMYYDEDYGFDYAIYSPMHWRQNDHTR